MSRRQKIGIIGAGESGVGAALLAQHVGDEPFVSDFGVIEDAYRQELIENKVRFEESRHTLEILLDCDCIVKSPGVPDHVDVIRRLREAGVEIVSEIEYAYRHMSDDAKLIAVTGSNGKTTTTNLTHHLIEREGVNVVKGGNLGVCFARLLVSSPADVYVIEISSFQLDDVWDLSPDVAILLNITPDHLDRYEYDFGKYAGAKMRLVDNLSDGAHVIFNADSVAIVGRLSAAEGVTYHPVSSERLCFADYEVDNVALRGPHNAFNASCAILAARTVGVSEDAIVEALSDFVNDAHRLQLVAEIDGVEWINDSKATNVDSTYYALQAMERPVVWIVGGADKGNDYSQIESLVEQRVKVIITLCVDRSRIEDAFGQSGVPMYHADDMEQAVDLAGSYAERGDAVLLSPACASFDLFKNYKDRGDQFIAGVRSREI